MDPKIGVFYDQRYANARHPNGLESAQNCSSQKSDVANSSLHLQAIKTESQCLKITGKVSFNIASEASYVYILSGQKLIKNAKNGPFGEFWKT